MTRQSSPLLRHRLTLALGILCMFVATVAWAAPATTWAAPAAAPARQTCPQLQEQDATVSPMCGPAGTTFLVSVTGFTPNEPISFWLTDPHGNVAGTSHPLSGSHPGHLDNVPIDTSGGGFYDGVWAVTFEGATSHHQSIARFQIGAAGPTPPPANCPQLQEQDATVTPMCGPAGTTFLVSVTGFTPDEPISFWFTDPHGNVVGTTHPISGSHGSHIDNFPIDTSGGGFDEGVWAMTFEGATSHHQSIARFQIGTPAPGATATAPSTETAAPATETAGPTSAPTETGVPVPTEILPTLPPATATTAPLPPTTAPPTAVPPPLIPTAPPTQALPPTAAPTATGATGGTTGGGTPGMPRTGAPAPALWPFALFLVGLILALGGLTARRRRA